MLSIKPEFHIQLNVQLHIDLVVLNFSDEKLPLIHLKNKQFKNPGLS